MFIVLAWIMIQLNAPWWVWALWGFNLFAAAFKDD